MLIIEPGEVELLGEVRMKNIGLPDKTVYACLAETTVLALEGRYENFTVGRNISWLAEAQGDLRAGAQARHEAGDDLWDQRDYTAENAAGVVLLDVDESALNDTLDDLASGTTEVSGYIVEFSDLDAVADTAAAVLDEVDRINVLVNNDGVVRTHHHFWETELESDAKFTVDVNTLAPVYVAHAFLPAMIAASGDCRLLNLASAAGFTPTCGWRCTPPRGGRSSAPLLPILDPADMVGPGDDSTLGL